MTDADGGPEAVDLEARLPPGLRSFVAREKSIFPWCPQRVGVDEAGFPVSGSDFASYQHGSAFGADRPGPFRIKGVWIPQSECTCFAADLSQVPPPFRRQSGDEVRFLFLVHPESESFFAPLLRRFQHTLADYPAVSLSSVRSLLVWVPSAGGDSTALFFVKLSLNAVVSGAARVLSDHECRSSIGNSLILETKQISGMEFMGDACAFVPAPEYMDRGAAVGHGERVPDACGMIVRGIPDFLLDPEPAVELLPLFSLFHGNGLLEGMVRRSGSTASVFLEDFLLRPFARAFVELLFFSQVSIEAHGQNLLWIVSSESGLPSRLMYRDMGGVNAMLMPRNTAHIEPRLLGESSYHQSTHLEDACDALEFHWVSSVLFNLTKRLVRSPELIARDPALCRWHGEMERGGFVGNWVCGGDAPADAHREVLPEAKYVRYGHVERLFQKVLVAEVRRRGILQAVCQQFAYFRSADETYDHSFRDRSAPWFRPFLYTLYSHWIECDGCSATGTRP